MMAKLAILICSALLLVNAVPMEQLNAAGQKCFAQTCAHLSNSKSACPGGACMAMIFTGDRDKCFQTCLTKTSH